MKKVAILVAVIGIIVLVLGLGVRLYVNNNPDVQEINEFVEMFLGKSINPKFASQIINGKVRIMGQLYSLDDLLELVDLGKDAKMIKAGLTIYAYSTPLMIIGTVLLLAGVGLFLGSSKRKYVPVSNDTYNSMYNY